MSTLANNNGFLVDPDGVVRGIEVGISAEPVTNFARVARHESLTIGANLQMTQRIRIIKMGSGGKELCEQVRELVLEGNVRSQLLNAYQDSIFSASTENTKVDPAGTPVSTGGVEELTFFQNITLGVLKTQGVTVVDQTPLTHLVYGLLKSQIVKLDSQGRL